MNQQIERVTVEVLRPFRILDKTYYPARPAQVDDKGKIIVEGQPADRVEVDLSMAAEVVNAKRARRVR